MSNDTLSQAIQDFTQQLAFLVIELAGDDAELQLKVTGAVIIEIVRTLDKERKRLSA